MELYTLQGNIRTDKGYKVRRDNQVPGVIYGSGMEPIHVGLPEADISQLLQRGTANMLIELTAGKKKYTVMVKELQRHRVKGDVLHLDFYAVDLAHKLITAVPIHLVGESPGVKEGGILQQQTREIEVRCLPTEIPHAFEVDISDLEIGSSKAVGDMCLADDLEIITPETEVVVSILAPRLEVVDETDEAEETEAGEAEVPAAETEGE